jgi:hypothetical protein
MIEFNEVKIIKKKFERGIFLIIFWQYKEKAVYLILATA